jgi:hypothetical protein
MEYLLMIYLEEDDWTNMTQAEQDRAMAPCLTYCEAMSKAGVLKGSNRLRPAATATTVRVVEGKSQLLDGPYVESKEQLAGYYLIDVPDLDAAIAWAAQCPVASYGIVEVRPIWNRP